MISNPIESEIETEHKVFRDFNMRQLVCIVTGALIALAMYIFFKDVMLMVIFSLPFALMLGYFSRRDDLGRPAEEVFFKKTREYVYKNSIRTMRTKNGYVKLYNNGMKDYLKERENKKIPLFKRIRTHSYVRKKKRTCEKKSIK